MATSTFHYTVTSKSRGFIRFVLSRYLNPAPLQPLAAARASLSLLQSELDAASAAGRVTRLVLDTAYSQYRASLTGSGPEPASEPGPTPISAPVDPVPAALAAARIGGAIEQAIAAALASASAPIDRESVVAICREEMDKGASNALREVTIKVGTLPAVAIGIAHKALPEALRVLAARLGGDTGKRNNLLLVGPSGSGKTVLTKQLARAMGLPYYYTGAIASQYALLGHTTATGDVVRTPFRDAFEKGGLFTWDELDASDPRALVAFNAAIDNGVCAFPDLVLTAHPDFVVVATANTWGTGATAEYVGRNRLDAATLDRYVPLYLDYDEKLEAALVGEAGAEWCKFVQRARGNARKHGIRMIISPRKTIQGALLIAAGESLAATKERVLFGACDATTRAKLAG